MQKDKQQELDAMLSEDWLQAPDDFTQQVMQGSQSAELSHKESLVSQWLQWVALAGGFLLGAQQLITFMFGVWLASATS